MLLRLLPLFLAVTAFAETVTVQFRNPSLMPKKIAIISYPEGDGFNNTFITTLLPKQKKSYRFRVGAKVYLADKRQVDTVMSGRSLVKQGDEPVLVVAPSDNGRIVDVP